MNREFISIQIYKGALTSAQSIPEFVLIGDLELGKIGLVPLNLKRILASDQSNGVAIINANGKPKFVIFVGFRGARKYCI